MGLDSPSYQTITLKGIMKKLISFFILLSMMSSAAAATQSQSVEQSDPGFVLLDVFFYRPVGLAVTILGTAAFIGLSPLTALASIPAPHDTFNKIGKILILVPAAYTFIRPIGDRDFPYHAPPYKYRPVAINNSAAIPKQSTVTPPVPAVQSPQLYPDAGKGL
jgi:hypothetical protein